jgi:hypothetical protein
MLASFDEFKKVGLDIIDAAKINYQRGMKIAEVTSSKDTDSLQGVHSVRLERMGYVNAAVATLCLRGVHLR